MPGPAGGKEENVPEESWTRDAPHLKRGPILIVRHIASLGPSNLTHRYRLKILKSIKVMHRNVHSTYIHNSLKWKNQEYV